MGGKIKAPLTWFISVAELLWYNKTKFYASVGYCPIGKGISTMYFGDAPNDYPPIIARFAIIKFNDGKNECVSADCCLNTKCPLNKLKPPGESNMDIAVYNFIQKLVDDIVKGLKELFGSQIFSNDGKIMVFEIPPLVYFVLPENVEKEGPSRGGNTS